MVSIENVINVRYLDGLVRSKVIKSMSYVLIAKKQQFFKALESVPPLSYNLGILLFRDMKNFCIKFSPVRM